MNDLLGADGIYRAATFSPCGKYRHTLWRIWKPWESGPPRLLKPFCVFVGLNPSTADAEVDDPTVRRLIGFAKGWGLSGFLLVNLFDFRATDPKEMRKAENPVSPWGDNALVLAQSLGAAFTVACWGNGGAHQGRGSEALELLGPLKCFGKTSAGMPRHPLYLSSTTELIDF